jgi:two-component system alkaline phosphatase synthesis response regulator PhoP
MTLGTTKERKSILVVDDDDQILYVWRGALEGHAKEWQVDTAQDGYEALEKIRSTPFDLIVTDLKMPGMDGCDLTVAVRRLDGTVPVIWITAYPEPGALAKADALGVARLVNKPIGIAQIRQIVAQTLEATN